MRIFVAMSGGVDSAVAALLLKREGHDVVGIHLRTGVKADPGAPGGRPRCCGADEAEDARRVCGLLDIPYYVQNTETEFAGLIAAFAEAYVGGLTPNPCVACNSDIKFGALLERARALGADAVATGHYARRRELAGRWAVARARDRDKDQSYVLYGLGQAELRCVRFPLGDLQKSEVRALAQAANLPVAAKPESQEICFVPSGDYRDLLRARRPGAFSPGEIVNEAGARLGEHGGIAGYTVGQRKGLGLATREPMFVLRLDPEKRQVVVGPRDRLGVAVVDVDHVMWSAIERPAPGDALEVDAVLRYRARAVRATLHAGAGDTVRVRFSQPAWPVTPGQAAVFYRDDSVLGGGRIRPKPSGTGPA